MASTDVHLDMSRRRAADCLRASTRRRGQHALAL